MSDQPDIQRMVGDVVRIGIVASVDHAGGTCRIDVGDIRTGDVPWLAGCAGATRAWSPPSVGEQVVLLCPEADTAAGIAVPGLYSNANPAPFDGEHVVGLAFADGARISYDVQAHALTAELPGGGTATIVAAGGITLRGDVTVEGKITATGDVKAGSISLQDHTHSGVQAGGAKTGKPA